MSKLIEQVTAAQLRSGFSKRNYLVDKNWSNYNYWKYRVLRPIIKVRYKAFRKKNSPSPWLSPAATLFFDNWLTKDHIGVEFGSGLSTVFFAKRTKKMIVVEHFKPWYEKVVELFKKHAVENVDYRFVAHQKGDEIIPDPSLFEAYDFATQNFEPRWDYLNYFTVLSDLEKESIDFILVDGRARPECLFMSLDKLKSGGLMVLDNSERERYSIVFDHLKDWSSYTTSNGLTDTTFWQKP